jgi:uncharacterized protein (TIGR02300 family)
LAKPEWGLKRTCLSCAAKFYDMNKDPIVCPACGTTFDPEAATKLKRGRSAPVEEKPKVDKAKAAGTGDGDDDDLDDDLDDDIDDDLDDDGVLEDTSDLDDEDVPAVAKGDGDDDDT